MCGCSVTWSCLTLCNLVDYSTPGSSVLLYLPSSLKLMSIESVMPSSPLVLCCPLLLASIFPNIRVFSSESALCIRWPKYWSFSFNISPSNEYSGLTSFRINWFDLANSEESSPTTTVQKHPFFSTQPSSDIRT